MSLLTPINCEQQDQPAYSLELDAVSENKPWYIDIKQYLEDGTFPLDATKTDRRAIRRLAIQFVLSGGVLYKRSPNLIWLRCLDSSEASQVVNEVHGGACGPRGKFTPNYEGPYIVRDKFSGGALRLGRMDDEDLPEPTNIEKVKRYYA